jgi:hypothetical protein
MASSSDGLMKEGWRRNCVQREQRKPSGRTAELPLYRSMHCSKWRARSHALMALHALLGGRTCPTKKV